MAYVLGFFAADGYITVNRRGGQYWCIQITDKELLERIKEVMGSDHAISHRSSINPNERALYRLQIGSKKLCDDARFLGFSERKTKCLVVPNVPQKYFSAFVRGYFDGDGNVWVGRIHKNRRKSMQAIQVAFTSCSKIFLQEIHERLGRHGISNGGIYCKKNAFRLQYSIRDSLALYRLMYTREGGFMYLPRKKEVFERYLKMRP